MSKTNKNTSLKTKRLGKYELCTRLLNGLDGYMESIDITKKHLKKMSLSMALTVMSEIYEQYYRAPLTGTLFLIVRDRLISLGCKS